jgi:hypothetical protein
MTRKTVSRTTTNRATANAASSTQKIPQTVASLVPANADPQVKRACEFFDLFSASREADRAEAEERSKRRAEREAKERAGILLRGPKLEQARNTLDQINLSAAAIHSVAMDVNQASDPTEAGWLIQVLQNAAETICRRCDVVSALLGDDLAGGNFEREFRPITDEEAARIEAEEAAE